MKKTNSPPEPRKSLPNEIDPLSYPLLANKGRTTKFVSRYEEVYEGLSRELFPSVNEESDFSLLKKNAKLCSPSSDHDVPKLISEHEVPIIFSEHNVPIIFSEHNVPIIISEHDQPILVTPTRKKRRALAPITPITTKRMKTTSLTPVMEEVELLTAEKDQMELLTPVSGKKESLKKKVCRETLQNLFGCDRVTLNNMFSTIKHSTTDLTKMKSWLNLHKEELVEHMNATVDLPLLDKLYHWIHVFKDLPDLFGGSKKDIKIWTLIRKIPYFEDFLNFFDNHGIISLLERI
jgi:hypothetical protein